MCGAWALVDRPASMTQALKLLGVTSSTHEAVASWVDAPEPDRNFMMYVFDWKIVFLAWWF